MPWGQPEPTHKILTGDEIVGLWKFNGTNSTMALCADQTFTIINSEFYEGSGTWSISGGSKKEIYLNYTDSGTSMIGYVVDSKDGELGIYGGISGDPDFWGQIGRVSRDCIS